MRNFIFSDNYVNNSPDCFTVQLGIIKDADDLFAQLHDTLHFPYFGWNWDALDECLSDLSWIEQKHIIIIHKSLPVLNNDDLQIYIDILLFSMEFHATHGEQFDVVLPQQTQNTINEIIKKIDS